MGKLYTYIPNGRVLGEFYWDNSPVAVIQGPIGSGTSTASIMRLWRHANEQQPGGDGARRTSWLIVRNTYSELERTTMKTWSMWFEERVAGRYGEMARTRPPHHRIKIPHPSNDETMIDAEFIFLALDVEEDVRRLMSIEPTGVFFNEAQFTPKELFDEAQSRAALGRYPPKLDGGPTWCGVIADLNAPSEGHWIPYMRGDVAFPTEWDEETRREYIKPEDWRFFIQPPGLIEVFEGNRVSGYKENPEAENRKWLPRPYSEVVKGKSKAWIDARVMNRVGLYKAGRPVFESFRPEMHITEKPLAFVPEFPLIVGLDFARNPAALFGQVIRGVLYIIAELGMENVAAKTFAPMVKQHIATNYGTPKVELWGDPTGASKGQSTDLTPFQIFGQNGMQVLPAPGNNRLPIRLETIETLLTGLGPGGVPKLQISPVCRMLKTAMNGGYHFRKIQGQTRWHDDPNKDRYADYADALQYLALGAGFGTETIAQPHSERNRPKKSKRRSGEGFTLRRRPATKRRGKFA